MTNKLKQYQILKKIYCNNGLSFHQYVTSVYRPFYIPFNKIIEWIEPGSRVLDIGCGTGLLLQLLNETIGLSESHGFDINEQSINTANKVNRYDHLNFINNKINDSIFNKINTVLLIDVLHHIPEDEKLDVLTNIFNKSQKGTRFIIKDLNPYPNWMAISNRLTDYISTKSIVSYLSVKSLEEIMSEFEFIFKTIQNIPKHVWSHYLIVGDKK